MNPIERAVVGAVLCTALCACAASNPERTDLPAPWQPTPKKTAAKTPPAATEAKSTPASTEAKPAATAAQSTDAEAASVARPGTESSAAPIKPSATAPAPAGADPIIATVGGDDPIIATVGGDPVNVSELLSQMWYLPNTYLYDQFDSLVISRIAYMEGNRLRVRLDPDEDSRAYEAAVENIETQIGRQHPGVKLDRWVDRQLGLDPIRFRARLREDTRCKQLVQRVMRAWLLAQERVEVHIIVVDSEDALKLVQQELKDGVPFEEVARKHSIDPSKEKGGKILPVVSRNSALGRLAFDTAVGAVGGPLSAEGSWLLARVDARPPPIEGPWSKVGAAVEASLKERPAEALEFGEWRLAMLERYQVDLKPFQDLVDGPAR